MILKKRKRLKKLILPKFFSRCPKNLSCPKFGGAAAPLVPPARTPMQRSEYQISNLYFPNYLTLQLTSKRYVLKTS